MMLTLDALTVSMLAAWNTPKQYGNGGHLMVVEIDPRDVVSVPLDCDQQKLRTAKYKVVSHFRKEVGRTNVRRLR